MKSLSRIVLFIPILALSILSFIYYYYGNILYLGIAKIDFISKDFKVLLSSIFNYVWLLFIIFLILNKNLAFWFAMLMYSIFLILFVGVKMKYDCPQCGMMGFLGNVSFDMQLGFICIMFCLLLVYFFFPKSGKSY